jgi:toxin secretion/phage lysis holin
MVYNFYNFIERFSGELKAVIYTSFVFLQIDPDVVEILMMLMFFDTLFGIAKAPFLGRKFSFKILWFGLISKILILLIPMTLALVGKGLKTYDFTPMVDMVLKVLLVSEGFSIITSMYEIKTKKKAENIDLITVLLSSIRKGLLSLINFWMKKIENPAGLPENINEEKK